MGVANIRHILRFETNRMGHPIRRRLPFNSQSENRRGRQLNVLVMVISLQLVSILSSCILLIHISGALNPAGLGE